VSATVAVTYTCDYCGLKAVVGAEPESMAPLPGGWHLLDGKHVCQVHRISVEVGGGQPAGPAPEVQGG